MPISPDEYIRIAKDPCGKSRGIRHVQDYIRLANDVPCPELPSSSSSSSSSGGLKCGDLNCPVPLSDLVATISNDTGCGCGAGQEVVLIWNGSSDTSTVEWRGSKSFCGNTQWFVLICHPSSVRPELRWWCGAEGNDPGEDSGVQISSEECDPYEAFFSGLQAPICCTLSGSSILNVTLTL